MSNRSQFPLQYLHQGVNATFPAALEMVTGSEIGSPLQLILTSPNDLMFYFYCNITDQMLKTMCDHLLIDTQMVTTFDKYLFPLLDNVSDKRTICLEDDDRRTGFVFTVHDKLDFQRIYRLRLPFERATDRSLAEYLSGLLSDAQKLVATQAAEISTLKSQNDKDSKSLSDRIAISQQDLQRKIDEFSELSRNYSKQSHELDTMSLNYTNLKATSTQEIASLKSGLEALQLKESAATAKLLELERNLASTTSALSLSQSDLKRTQETLALREKECERLHKECTELTKVRRELEQEKHELSLQLTSLTERNNSANEQHAVRFNLLRSQNEELMKNIEELKEAAGTLSEECDQLGLKYNTVLDERTQLENKLGEVVETLTLRTQQVSGLTKNLEELSSAKEALEAKVASDAQTINKLSTALQAAHHQKTQAETKLEKLTVTITTQKNMIEKLTSLKGDELLAEMQDGRAPAVRKDVLAKPPSLPPAQQFEVLDLGPMLQKNAPKSKPSFSQNSDLALSPSRPAQASYDSASFSGSDVYSQDTNSLLTRLGNIRTRQENKPPRIVEAPRPSLPAASTQLQDSSSISVVGFTSKKDSPPACKPSQPETSTSGNQYAMAYMNFMRNIN